MDLKPAHPPAAEAGFSLIEVLIAVLILAFGVVSMGGLQLASLKSNQISGYSATAATLVKDYTEMMRSNALRSTIRSLITGKAFARNGSSHTSSPSL